MPNNGINSIKLYNLKGEVEKKYQKMNEVNVEALSPGIYLLAVEMVDQKIKRQLIIKTKDSEKTSQNSHKI